MGYTHFQIFVPYSKYYDFQSKKKLSSGLVGQSLEETFLLNLTGLVCITSHQISNLQQNYSLLSISSITSMHFNTYHTIDQRGLQFLVLCISLFSRILNDMTKSYFWTFLCERLCPLAQCECDKWERQRKLSRQKKSRADLFVQKWKFSPHQFGLAWCFKCPFVHRGSISDYNESWLNKNRHMKNADPAYLEIKIHIEVVYWNDLRSNEATGTFEYNINPFHPSLFELFQ